MKMIFVLIICLTSVTRTMESHAAYPEYEHYYKTMNSKQRELFKKFVSSYRLFNKTINTISKDELVTMNTSHRENNIQDLLYADLKTNENYSHTDDQKLNLSLFEKYSPNSNSQYFTTSNHSLLKISQFKKNEEFFQLHDLHKEQYEMKIISTTEPALANSEQIMKNMGNNYAVSKSLNYNSENITEKVEEICISDDVCSRTILETLSQTHRITDIQNGFSDKNPTKMSDYESNKNLDSDIINYEKSFKRYLKREKDNIQNIIDFHNQLDEEGASYVEITTEDPLFNSSYYKYIEEQFEKMEHNNIHITDVNEIHTKILGEKINTKNIPDKEKESKTKIFTVKESIEKFLDKKVFKNSAELCADGDHVNPGKENLVYNKKHGNKVQKTSILRERATEKLDLKNLKRTTNLDIYESKTIRTIHEVTIKTNDQTKNVIANTTLVKESERMIEITHPVNNPLNQRKQSYRKTAKSRSNNKRHRYRKRHWNHNGYIPKNAYYQHLYQSHVYPPPRYIPQYLHYPPFHQYTTYNHQTNPPITEKLTTDQYQLYLKLKELFHPVDKTLKELMNTPTTKSNRKTEPYTWADEKLQKYLERLLDLPEPPTGNISHIPTEISIKDILPKDIYNDTRYFNDHTGKLSDLHPAYLRDNPNATKSRSRHIPRRYNKHKQYKFRKQSHKKYKKHQHHCCCHHEHGQNENQRETLTPRNLLFEESRRVILSYAPRNVPITGYHTFDYTSFETLYRGLPYGPKPRIPAHYQ